MREAPEIKIPFLKYLWGSVDEPIRLRTQIFNTYGDLAKKTVPGAVTYYVRHPRAVEHILEKHQDIYPYKHRMLINVLAPFLGFESVLLSSNLERWYHDRMIAQISFDEKVYFQHYSETIVSLCNQMLDRWEREYKDHQLINIPQEIDTLLIDIVVQTLFTQLDLLKPEELAKMVPEIVEKIKTKLRFVHPAFFFFSPQKKKYEELIADVRKLSKSIVAARLKENKSWDDMLGHFIRDYLPKYSEEEIIENLSYQISTFLVVGYFTTSALLHWSLVIYSQYPTIAEEICRESQTVLGSRDPSYADIRSLPFLSATIKETLRFRPSNDSIMRTAVQEDEIDGFFIKKNAGIVISVSHVHRHPDFWINPDGFDPTRFLTNPLGQEDKYAYIPFGAGRRNCIASAFATMEATLIIPLILRRFRLYLPPHTTVEPFVTSLLTNRPTATHMHLRKVS